MKTDITVTDADRIVIRGRDLVTELMGVADYADVMILTSLGRFPTAAEKQLTNAIMVSVMDHGITPSSLAARLTLLGAPEAFQAAIAAGLVGAGSTFLGGMQDVTELLYEGAAGLELDDGDDAFASAAQDLVARRRAESKRIPGVGHNVHTSTDPRVDRMREIARSVDLYDKHWRLLDHLPAAVTAASGKVLPLNNVGAIGASVASLGFPAVMGKGMALAARAGGLVAHLMEEVHEPLAKAVWESTLHALDADRVTTPRLD